jgi:hypothetical protein
VEQANICVQFRLLTGEAHENMVTSFGILIGHLLTWLAFAAGAFYAGMVLMRYRKKGPHYRLSLLVQDPARSVQGLMVWLGVKVLGGCLRIARHLLNMLLEASAEVGEWYIRVSPAAWESIRSRFRA